MRAHSSILPTGLALFSMFFGAGNVIFPLAVGHYAGDQSLYAMSGLILTAVCMPILGAVAMVLFKGNYRHFFGRLGALPGFLLALMIISLLGPFGSAPRCITLSYSAIKSVFPSLSLPLFSALCCGCLYLFIVRKRMILTLLGLVLTPLLLTTLLILIIWGLLTPSVAPTVESPPSSLFLHGLKEGYLTMDLLAAFFFSSSILTLLKAKKVANPFYTTFYASLITAALLVIIYLGFGYLASSHSHHLGPLSKDQLLSAIALKVAGPSAQFFVVATITLACFTTAVALIAAFTDFCSRELFGDRLSEKWILAGALCLTFFISTLEFTGISAFLEPLLEVVYPGLILLTLLNIAYHFKIVLPVKPLVFSLFFLAALFQLFKSLHFGF